MVMEPTATPLLALSPWHRGGSPFTSSGAVTEDIDCCPVPLPERLAPNEPLLVPNKHHIETQPWWAPSGHHTSNLGGGHRGAWTGAQRFKEKPSSFLVSMKPF